MNKIDQLFLFDRPLFVLRRVFNRTFGRYILRWDHNGPAIFGYCFILKRTVQRLNSKEYKRNLYAGLSFDEIQELKRTLDILNPLPWAGLPDGTFTERQMHEHGIRLVGNFLYVYRA